MKKILVFFSAGAFVVFLWFALACVEIVSKSKASLYIASTFGGLFVNGTIPIFIEIAVEVRACACMLHGWPYAQMLIASVACRGRIPSPRGRLQFC